MSPCIATGHACVRVGPLGGGMLIARWPEARGCRCRGGQAVTGTLLAACARSPVRQLELADVIVAGGAAGSAGPSGWLRRYPGCAVAACPGRAGLCSVATRDGVIGHLAGSGLSAAGALACAVFVHGWLSAGWPLDLLRPARLHVACHAGAGLVPGTPLFFRFSYCAAPGDDPGMFGWPGRPDSLNRTCRASGAPSAS